MTEKVNIDLKPKSKLICNNCSKEIIKADAQFCPFCGSKVETALKQCLQCGTMCIRHDRFCYHCGKSLNNIGVAIGENEYE